MRRNYFFSLPYISCVMAHISFTASNEFHKFSDGFSVVDWKLHIHSHVAITHRVRIIHHDAAKLRSSFRIFGSNGSSASREDTECRLSRAPVYLRTIWTFSQSALKLVFAEGFLVYFFSFMSIYRSSIVLVAPVEVKANKLVLIVKFATKYIRKLREIIRLWHIQYHRVAIVHHHQWSGQCIMIPEKFNGRKIQFNSAPRVYGDWRLIGSHAVLLIRASLMIYLYQFSA